MLSVISTMAVAAQILFSNFFVFLWADPMKVVQTLIYVAAGLNVAFITFVIIKYFINGKK